MATQTHYDFTVVLSGVTELTIEMAEALYRAGCDDGSPASSDGRVTIDFHRQATSLEAAIQTAVRDVYTAGLRVARVELEVPELVSA